jgi:hypothetical protein
VASALDGGRPVSSESARVELGANSAGDALVGGQWVKSVGVGESSFRARALLVSCLEDGEPEAVAAFKEEQGRIVAADP